MSKPVKQLIRKELASRFDGLTSLAICGLTGIDAITTNEMRGRLREKEIRLTVVKNSVARQAFRDVGIDTAAELLEGPCAVAYGSDSIVSVVRELLDIKKESAPSLTVKAAVLEGDVFGDEEEVKRLSKFPTREEAIADVLGAVLAPASNLASCLIAPAGELAGILKTIEENQGGGEEEAA
jgi:large subunit ribosomal protein L10